MTFAELIAFAMTIEDKRILDHTVYLDTGRTKMEFGKEIAIVEPVEGIWVDGENDIVISPKEAAEIEALPADEEV